MHNRGPGTFRDGDPAIVALAKVPSGFDLACFHQVAVMAYGWMPRVLRLDRAHVEPALIALLPARAVNAADVVAGDIEPVARCLHSVVGGSKVLHFVNPDVFPIWDSGIARFRGVRARLEASEIQPYDITAVRIVDAAAFELAPKPVGGPGKRIRRKARSGVKSTTRRGRR
jgi:hypothetical protein